MRQYHGHPHGEAPVRHDPQTPVEARPSRDHRAGKSKWAALFRQSTPANQVVLELAFGYSCGLRRRHQKRCAGHANLLPVRLIHSWSGSSHGAAFINGRGARSSVRTTRYPKSTARGDHGNRRRLSSPTCTRATNTNMMSPAGPERPQQTVTDRARQANATALNLWTRYVVAPCRQQSSPPQAGAPAVGPILAASAVTCKASPIPTRSAARCRSARRFVPL